MPVYEFKCDTCGKKFELLVNVPYRSGDTATLQCPHCKSVNVTKLVSNVNFRLVGSSWARDGYENKKGGG
ncbi:MAG: FmdB family zinc ribbon protein [Candidatus Heimdallarchaeaceae archaeon]